MSHYRYVPSMLDDIESLEGYRAGGYHPVHLGDMFDGGRYKVLHKLGYGGGSTVWLARDLRPETPSCTLVSLKVLASQFSQGLVIETPDIYIPEKLADLAKTTGHAGGGSVLRSLRHFMHEGPNGAHLCLVSECGGPSLRQIVDCPGRWEGSKRLRADIARKVAGQAVNAVSFLHSVEVVHGDLTSSNFLFRMSDAVQGWEDEDVVRFCGKPVTERMLSNDRSVQIGPEAPQYVVKPFKAAQLASPDLLREELLLIDFGQAFFADHKPPSYEPATQFYYLSPEFYFDKDVGFASDVWALGCLLFEIRAGRRLFDSFFADPDLIFREIVLTLGKLPDRWWGTWEARERWFTPDGAPILETPPGAARPPVDATEVTSLRKQLRSVGTEDSPSGVDDGIMFEKAGTRIEEEEVELLGDLLEKMLRFEPERRITLEEVKEHPWFKHQ